MQIKLLQIQLSDLDIALGRYPGAKYWDPTHKTSSDEILSIIESETGIYILNGLIPASGIDDTLRFRLINLARVPNPDLEVVILTPKIKVSGDLYSFVELDEITLPDTARISTILHEFKLSTPSNITACLGLTEGEIRRVASKLSGDCSTQILAYKQGKLKASGFELLPAPDVEVAGLDNINRTLDNASKLLEPEAQKFGLKFPKGVLMWGIPGSGKSLCTKHAATRMNLPLIAVDWGGLLSPVAGESEQRLQNLLSVAEALSPCILAFDDFDKAFSSSDLSGESSTEKRIAGILLTWLQDCDKPVYTMASVNRAEQMPPELLRRFTDIYFFDFPHQGQSKEIFDLHLAKYTDSFEADRVQWQQILRKYQYCTPAEIGRAVTKAAERAFFEDRPQEITHQDLLEERDNFVSGYNRDKAAILRIQKNASLAMPSTSEDNSVWKVEASPMFENLLGTKTNDQSNSSHNSTR